MNEEREVIEGDSLIGLIGEAVHTGLRKGSDRAEAHDLWVAISDSEAWYEAVGYAVWAFEKMGIVVTREKK